MHSYHILDILARFRFPIIVQLLIAANDIAYKRGHRELANTISTALDQAVEYYISTGRMRP